MEKRMTRLPDLPREAVKLLAILLMTGNHFAHLFLREGSVLYCLLVYLGHFTAVTMCAQLVEGFYRTRSRKRYAMRLFACALISQVPFRMMLDSVLTHEPSDPAAYLSAGLSAFGSRVLLQSWNMMYTLFFCLLFLCVQECVKEEGLRAVLSAGCFAASMYGDWPGLAVLFTWLFYRQRKNGQMSLRQVYTIAAAVVAFAEFAALTEEGLTLPVSMLRSLLSTSGVFLSMAVMTGGGRVQAVRRGSAAGFVSRWFFYLYYPVHMVILVMLYNYQF